MRRIYLLLFPAVWLWACDTPPESSLYSNSGTWHISRYGYSDAATGEQLTETDAGFFMFFEATDGYATDPEGNLLDTYDGLYHLKITTGTPGKPAGTYDYGIGYLFYEGVLNVFPENGGAWYFTVKGSAFSKILTRNSGSITETYELHHVNNTGGMPEYQ